MLWGLTRGRPRRPAAGFPGSYLPGFSPLTRALKSAPGRNLGTEELGTWIVAPVAGFLAVRAGRSLFSKTPNPVIATLSPLATASWMASSTALTASVAGFLPPSRPEIASTRSRLFIFTPALPHRSRVGSVTGPRPLTCPKVSDPAPLHNNHRHFRRRVGRNCAPGTTHRTRNSAIGDIPATACSDAGFAVPGLLVIPWAGPVIPGRA